ncbi:MAG: glycosyltransferase family A protein, partial [Myxococcota bacterium]
MSLLPKSLTDRYFKTYRRILGGDDYTRSLHQQVNELRSRLQAVAGDELEDGPSSWKWRAVELARHTATRINGLQSRFLPGSMSRPIERLISRGFPAPLVSVIMTAFNCRDYLRDAISTALWQTYGNVELIVVDDRSDDGTFDLLCEIAEDDDRIRVLRTDERGGTYRAKNLGLSQAFGQYVTFQDSDDLVAPTRLSAQVSGLLVRPWAVASVCRYARFDEDSEVVMNRGRYTRRALISLLFKRDVVLRRLGFFDEVWTSADDEFVERLTRV